MNRKLYADPLDGPKGEKCAQVDRQKLQKHATFVGESEGDGERSVEGKEQELSVALICNTNCESDNKQA